MAYFVMGGARDVVFYRDSIDYMIKAQKNANIPDFKELDVLHYLHGNIKFEVANDQRLVISQMLAQPIEMIPEIENMPWDLKENNDYLSEDMNSVDYSLYMQELQDSLYPK